MSAFDLRMRPHGCWDPLTSKQVTVRYDSHRKLLRVFRAYAELAEAAVRQNVSRAFFRNTRCGRYGAFQSVVGFRSVSLVPQSSIPEFNVSFGSAAPLLQILGILRNDVHVHRRRLPQEPMHCR